MSSNVFPTVVYWMKARKRTNWMREKLFFQIHFPAALKTRAKRAFHVITFSHHEHISLVSHPSIVSSLLVFVFLLSSFRWRFFIIRSSRNWCSLKGEKTFWIVKVRKWWKHTSIVSRTSSCKYKNLKANNEEINFWWWCSFSWWHNDAECLVGSWSY